MADLPGGLGLGLGYALRVRLRAHRCTTAALLGLCLTGCGQDPVQSSAVDELRQPSGLALLPGGRWLAVTNGNWDLRRTSATLVLMDLEALDEGLAAPREVAARLDRNRPCRRVPERQALECDPAALIEADATVRLLDGAGNVAVDLESGGEGGARLLVPTRIDASLTWIDAIEVDGDAPRLDCGQGPNRRCDEEHEVFVDTEPSRVTVDDQGNRFAYLPHLLERRLSLITLDGSFGPEISDVQEEFFDVDPLHDTGLGGGFAVASRACTEGNAPSNTVDCTRPYLYASQRFWFGVRKFRVAPGLDVVLNGGSTAVTGVNVDSAIERPLMGDLKFLDPADGRDLLIVHTTPPGLTRVDTSLGSDGIPVDVTRQSVPVCENPNLLELHRPDDGPWLAFISCYSADEVAVIDLSTWTAIATLALGDGPNEMLVDEMRRRLYVANVLEHSISVVDLRRDSPRFLRELAVIGIGKPREAD